MKIVLIEMRAGYWVAFAQEAGIDYRMCPWDFDTMVGQLGWKLI